MLNISRSNCRLAVGIWLFCALGFVGCYQRELTPEIEYSNADVELIRQEIDAFEWIDVTICPVDNDWAVNGQSFMAKVKEFAMKFSLESRIPVALLLVFLLVGCEGSSEVKFRFNQVEWVKQERLNLEDGDQFDEAYKREIGTILTALFGTPDDPRFPFLFDEKTTQLAKFSNSKI